METYGKREREWMLNSSDHCMPCPGTGSAAALASVSIVFRGIDDDLSSAALSKARDIFRFATSRDAKPQSYCDFVPCTANVTVTEQVFCFVLSCQGK